jgi:hypothetical protein
VRRYARAHRAEAERLSNSLREISDKPEIVTIVVVALHNRGKLAPADPKPGNEVIAAPYALAAIRLADLSSETPSAPRNWIGAFSDWRK